MKRRPGVRLATGALAADAVAHLLFLLGGSQRAAEATQWALMPLLAAAVSLATRSPRSPLVRGTLVALFFSWLGDSAPDFAAENGFLVMVGFFLLAQASYLHTFAPYAHNSLAVRAPWSLLVYGAAFVGLVAACWRGAGSLRLPTIIYGLALTSMAVLATGIGRKAGLGGALFLLSDSLIALGAFTRLGGRWREVAVMATYVAAQALIAWDVVSHPQAPSL